MVDESNHRTHVERDFGFWTRSFLSDPPNCCLGKKAIVGKTSAIREETKMEIVAGILLFWQTAQRLLLRILGVVAYFLSLKR